MARRYQNRIELLQGTLDMLILRVASLGPIHGYAIAQRIQQISRDVLRVQQGSLYPALHRLERQRRVESEWRKTESNQRAKYYWITAAGKEQLAENRGRWEQMVAAIGGVLAARADAPSAPFLR